MWIKYHRGEAKVAGSARSAHARACIIWPSVSATGGKTWQTPTSARSDGGVTLGRLCRPMGVTDEAITAIHPTELELEACLIVDKPKEKWPRNPEGDLRCSRGLWTSKGLLAA